MAEPGFTLRKNYKILDKVPEKLGGQALNENFIRVGDDIESADARITALEAAGGGGLLKQGATSLAVYTDLLPAGIDETDLGPDSFTVAVESPGAASVGFIRFSIAPSPLNNAVDGETVVVGDGTNVVTFEFDDDATVTPGNTPVTIGANWNATRTNLDTAINNSILAVSSSFGTVTNDTPGSHGNVRFKSQYAGDIGISSPVDGEAVAVFDGTFTLRFEFDDDGSTFGGNTAVTIGGTDTDTRDNLKAAIDGSVLDVTTEAIGATDLRIILNTPQEKTTGHTVRKGGKITCVGCADGDIVTITNLVNTEGDFEPSKTFEFDDDGQVGIGSIAVTLAGTDNGDAANLRSAIFNAGFFPSFSSKVVANVITLQQNFDSDDTFSPMSSTGGISTVGLQGPSLKNRWDFTLRGMWAGYLPIVDVNSPRTAGFGYNISANNSPDAFVFGSDCQLFDAAESALGGYFAQVWSPQCAVFGTNLIIDEDAEDSVLLGVNGIINAGAWRSMGLGYQTQNDYPRGFTLGGGVTWGDAISIGEAAFAGFWAISVGHDTDVNDENIGIGHDITIAGGFKCVGMGPVDDEVRGQDRPGISSFRTNVDLEGDGHVGIGAAVGADNCDYATIVGHWSSCGQSDHGSALGARCYIGLNHHRALLLGADLDSEAPNQGSMSVEALKLVPQGRQGNGGAIFLAQRVVEDVTIPQGNGSTGFASSGTIAKQGLILGATARVVTPDVAGATTVDVGITGLGTAAALIDDLDAATGGATKESFGGNDGTSMPVTNSTDKTVTLTTNVNVVDVGGLTVRVEVWYMSLVAPSL
jgi:hypothetical protein